LQATARQHRKRQLRPGPCSLQAQLNTYHSLLPPLLFPWAATSHLRLSKLLAQLTHSKSTQWPSRCLLVSLQCTSIAPSRARPGLSRWACRSALCSSIFAFILVLHSFVGSNGADSPLQAPICITIVSQRGKVSSAAPSLCRVHLSPHRILHIIDYTGG
jgi:hypothetical protein